MKFTDMTYTRPDFEGLKTQLEAMLQQFRDAQSAEQAADLLLAMDQLESDAIATNVTLASIRRNIDTRDAFYDAEMTLIEQELPRLKPLSKARQEALLASPFRAELEERFGKLLFLKAEIAARSFSPELVEDLQKENVLVSRYHKLIASAQIDFEGNTYTISQLAPFKQDPDDARRLAAWKAEGLWYREHGKELDEIYDELVRLRDGMGRKLGHDGYTPLGYDRMNRNCYTMEDVEDFRIAVQDYLVPLAKKIYIRQAKRMEKDFPLNFADKDMAFRSGNPRPVGTPEEILKTGEAFYSSLSPETREYWEFMMENGLMDVESKPGKRAGGYCTMIPSYKSPFIFANFNGTAHDVEVITHEAGHAFETYLNRNRIPSDYIWATLEASEVHSMSMEFFAESWAEAFFGEDAPKFLYTHLTNALSFIPYGTMVDHFQHIMFEYPEFDPEERHQVWGELLQLYMPWVKLGEVPFYGEARGWQRQQHIYARPFYYIDYCLAQTVALQFWLMIRKDPKAAFDTYLRYTKLGGSMVFTDLLKEAGLRSPFDPQTLKDICAEASRWIDSYDLAGLE